MDKRRVVQKIDAITTDNKPIEVMAVGDLHLGDSSMDKSALTKIAKWVNAKGNRYIVIAGDIFNAALKNSVSDVYEETMTVQECLDVFTDFVSTLRAGSIIGVVSGNHDRRVKKVAGVDVVSVACKLAKIEYLGPEGFISLKLKNTHENSTDIVTYYMYVTHGSGGGSTIGGAVNSMLRLQNIVCADIYVQGHTHKPTIIPSSIYRPGKGGRDIVEVQRMSMTCAALGERSEYAKEFAFAPTSNLCPVVTLSNKRYTMSGTLIDLG